MVEGRPRRPSGIGYTSALVSRRVCRREMALTIVGNAQAVDKPFRQVLSGGLAADPNTDKWVGVLEPPAPASWACGCSCVLIGWSFRAGVGWVCGLAACLVDGS